MKKFILFLLVFILFSGCADVVIVDECLPHDPYGFWGGLWHGWIAGISFFGSILSDDIAMYAINNNGGWYDFGFWLGVGSLGSGVTRTVTRRR